MYAKSNPADERSHYCAISAKLLFRIDFKVVNCVLTAQGVQVTVGLTAVFIFRERRTYFKDPYNYFDWLGLILTFLVIPLRFAEVRSQWSVAALGYLFNFLRLFKFSCVTR